MQEKRHRAEIPLGHGVSPGPLPAPTKTKKETGKTLVVTPSLCTGCRTCELACSFVGAAQGGMRTTRIRAYSWSEEENVTVMCLQCDEAACQQVCPTDALVRNPLTKAIDVIEARCISCKLCVVACPFGAMGIEDGPSIAHKCDLCGGNPMCAMFCPTKSLEYR